MAGQLHPQLTAQHTAMLMTNANMPDGTKLANTWCPCQEVSMQHKHVSKRGTKLADRLLAHAASVVR